jgi:hypothetical protein
LPRLGLSAFSRRLQRFRVVLGDGEQAQGGTDGLAGAISDE